MRASRAGLVGVTRLAAALIAALLVVLGGPGSPAAQAAPSRVRGSGSSYVAIAMQQWVAEGQSRGLEINYQPSGSPQGLTAYGQSLTDFGATEAEFSALQASGGEQQRGFQYVPDVGGATAVLYHVQEKSGKKVDYLHLSPRTIARIFTGEICRWSDPAITADNAGIEFPDEAINVVYRAGQSGQTGTFYDYVAHIAPDVFGPWAARYQFPTGDIRIIQLDSSPNFACKTQAFSSSDQIAQHIASGSGVWSIGYDEFGYAKTYKANAAWVQNPAGEWVLPYAENISAALESARLRSDLSQELSGVYTSTNPKAYPISAYSYLVTQCEPSGDRPTCKGGYSSDGTEETLTKWMRYIACEGQVRMAQIGYSPLPPNLSQEVANSIARMTGGAPEQLNAGNCANPRFSGSLGAGASSPKASPLAERIAQKSKSDNGGGGGGNGPAKGPGAASSSGTAGGASTQAASTGAASADTAGSGPAAEAAVAVDDPTDPEAAQGNRRWRAADPVLYRAPSTPLTPWPLVLLLAVVVVPATVGGLVRRRRRLRGAPSHGSSG